MALTSGTKLGPYEIHSSLGAGGMGEVYRARDSRLERDVAIKVLPASLSSDPLLKQRLEREAKAISKLSHPHICTLHDIGQQDGVVFLVMELLEGETLEQRLNKGPLPLEQTIRYSAQIADALAKAHRMGFTHRDLKPANIMLTKSGAKLMDFGLAKQSATAPLTTALTEMTAEQSKLTGDGMLVGTIQYMAPEQLEGKEVDARTDIFALGEVLYEMATGKPAFSGKSRASLIASILTTEPPPMSHLQPLTPPSLERVVKKCLAKDPDERWESASDLASELSWITDAAQQGAPATATAHARTNRERIAWALLVLLSTAFSVWMLLHHRDSQALLPLKLAIPAPPRTELSINGGDGMLAVSPDGHYLAFVTLTNGRRSLWLRALDSDEARNIPNTEDAAYPFWSPDSRNLAFFAGGLLKKIDVAGGSPQTICEALAARGGSWGTGGTILFAPGIVSGLNLVSATGGQATKVTNVEKSASHRWPFFLPDGKHFLFVSHGDGLYVGSLDSERQQLLVSGAGSGAYADGFVFYVREGTLFAHRFDPSNVALSGEPVTISGGMGNFAGRSYGVFSVSLNGILAYRTADLSAQLTWFDRRGKTLVTVGPADYFSELDLSPDEHRLVVNRGSLRGPADIWMIDLERGNLSRLTHRGQDSGAATWSPDARWIVFNSIQNRRSSVFQIDSSGAGKEEELLHESAGDTYVDDWSRDGRFVLLEQTPESGRNDLWVLPMSGDHRPFPYLQNSSYKAHARFSPDGRFVAYTSDESGSEEIYVERFPAGHGKWKISSRGGDQPYWRWDGKELFYLDLDRRLMAVPVRMSSNFEAGDPVTLFQTRAPHMAVSDERNYYVPSHDGQRFLVSTIDERTGLGPITVVVNWRSLIKR